jgi:hypothetical protein
MNKSVWPITYGNAEASQRSDHKLFAIGHKLLVEEG